MVLLVGYKVCMFKKFRNKKGFTLIEILVSVALIGSLLTLSVPTYSRFQKSNSLESASRITIAAVNEAKVLSSSMQENDLWSVYIDSNGVTVFKGPEYDSRDTLDDRRFPFPTSVAVSGDTVFSFSKGKSELEQNKQVNLSLSSQSISINFGKYGNVTVN